MLTCYISDSPLTLNDEYIMRNTIVTVENAGVPEVNGVYTFDSVRVHSGFYKRRGLYMGKEVDFTLYKCSVQNSGNQV